MQAETLLLALLIDAAIGDPGWLYRRVPHPVALIGNAAALGERAANRGRLGARGQLIGGLALTVALTMGAVLVGLGLERALAPVPGGQVAGALVASTLIAGRGLYDHVLAVARALGQGLDHAREAVSHLVGRDPDRLDRAGVARAAIESLAENFSDGFVAPLFWGLIGGLPGLLGYKAVNTLDSMLGHRTERLEWFGKVPARLDDVVNWLPARLAGLLVCAAALVLPGTSGVRALRMMWRDAARHRSPNAGWQEAAMAGALGIALAGPRDYGDYLVDDAWMGDGTPDVGAADVHRALRVYLCAAALAAGVVGIAALA